VDRLNQPQLNSFVVSGSIGIHGVHFSEANEFHVGELDVILLEQDQTGKVLHESTHRLNLRFTESKYSAVLKSGINFREPVPLENGATTLRVLVQDPATGAIGSLIIPVSQVQ
jgi:hypothetical protein